MDVPAPSAAGMFPTAMSPFQAVPYGVEIANRVFVGGCPYNMTELEMTKFFSKFGEVRDAKIITDRDGGKPRGYGFVTFATEEQAANVYSKGSIYYEQKKLNVAKAIRKHGGQYQKANQEFVNGQHRLVWLHPNGYLMTQHEGGWLMENLPSHSQPAKPYYSLLPPPSPTHPGGMYYAPGLYMQPAHLPSPVYAGGGFYNYEAPAPYGTDETLSVISTPNADPSSSHYTPPVGHDVELTREEKGYPIDMKALEAKTKQLSLDSAYTSEADFDSSHNTTATNSGTTSPKESYHFASKLMNSAPSSPKREKTPPEPESNTLKEEDEASA